MVFCEGYLWLRSIFTRGGGLGLAWGAGGDRGEVRGRGMGALSSRGRPITNEKVTR